MDEGRVYLTGISCGTEAIWDYLAEHANEIVAAAVPIAGGMPPGAGCGPAAVPVWAFHGERDEVFPAGDVSSQIETLKDCDGAQLELTLYPDTFTTHGRGPTTSRRATTSTPGCCSSTSADAGR